MMNPQTAYFHKQVIFSCAYKAPGEREEIQLYGRIFLSVDLQTLLLYFSGK